MRGKVHGIKLLGSNLLNIPRSKMTFLGKAIEYSGRTLARPKATFALY